MKIPRIKLPDKNLISLREFISGWRVNYHSPGLGRFKLNLGKTTTFPRSTLRRICQIHSRWKTASKRDLCACSSCWLSGCGWWGWCLLGVTLRYGCCSLWRHWSLDIDGRRALGRQQSRARHFPSLWCQLAFSPAPRTPSEGDKQAGRWQLMSQLSPKISGEYIMDTKIFPCHYLGNILSKKHHKMCPGHVTHSLLAQQNVLRLINGITRPLLNRSLSLNQNHWLLWSGACPGAGWCWVMGQRGANQVSIDTNPAMVTPGQWSPRHQWPPHHIPPSESLYAGLFNYLTQTNKIPCLLCSSLPSSEIHKKLAVFPEIGIR